MNNDIDQEIANDYQQLIADEKKQGTKKANVLLVLFILSFIIALGSAMFAYHNYNRLKNQNQHKNISIKYENQIALNIQNPLPDSDKPLQTIVIENNSAKQVIYKLEFIKVTNSLNLEDNINYRILRDNKIVLDNQKLPVNDSSLLAKEIVNPHTKVTYQLVVYNSQPVTISQDNQGVFIGTLWLKVNDKD